MVPTPINLRARSHGFLYPLASFVVHHVARFANHVFYGAQNATLDEPAHLHSYVKREEKHDTKFIVFAILIPVLVLLSGLFAGLTLGYMSLDETQLHVLSVSGTSKQKEYARKIEPIRKNGHLLLITLILANMIVNETLPLISEPVLGGGIQSVVVSTVLIVIFSEIIPQSLCTRYGLAIGANMAWLVRIMILVLGIVSWPVAKLLELILGSHHGIMYRRSELKELIAMHATTGELGGDLKTDTVTIIGATLDLQEKVVRQAMTPIDKVFMLNIESKLDYDTMKLIDDSGHSRVPVYEEIEVPVPVVDKDVMSGNKAPPIQTQKVRKILGILLVKRCLMLDPKDATPLRNLPLHKVNCVPNNMSLLAILDRFQEGRSHMAIVSRFSEDKAASVKHQVKKGLTERLKERVGITDSSGSESESDSDSEAEGTASSAAGSTRSKKGWRRRFRRKGSNPDVEKAEKSEEKDGKDEKKGTVSPQGTLGKLLAPGREQALPDDAVLPKDKADEFLQGFEPSVAPLGIITLEDVLEELIGEEIYDEFDPEGESRLKSYSAPKPKSRGRSARVAREQQVQFSPVAPSEGTTAIGGDELADGETTPKSHSMPTSPNLSVSNEDGPISRTSSLGQSLNVIAIHRRMRTGNTGSPTPSHAGLRSPRERSLQRKAKSEGEVTEVGLAPLSATPEHIGDLQEEPERIPDTQEKSGPDIERDDGEEAKKD